MVFGFVEWVTQWFRRSGLHDRHCGRHRAAACCDSGRMGADFVRHARQLADPGGGVGL